LQKEIYFPGNQSGKGKNRYFLMNQIGAFVIIIWTRDRKNVVEHQQKPL